MLYKMSNISVEGVILPNESISNLMINDAVDKDSKF